MGSNVAIVTRSPEETRILGAALAPVLLPGDVISLSGDLGAGKTTFVQGLAGALGVRGPVTSPTFTLVHQYDGRFPLVHLDVLRLNSFQEVIDLGFEELLDPEAIMVVEWGEAVAPLLPRRHLELELRRTDGAEDHRKLTFRPRGEEWARKLAGMRPTAEALLAAVASGDDDLARFVDESAPAAGGPRVGDPPEAEM